MSAAIATPRPDVDQVAWALAVGLFVAGDLATTAWGLRLGFVEANPVLALALGDVTIAKLAVAKAVGLGVAFVLYRRMDAWNLAAPLVLALGGAAYVGWNLGVIVA